jgi:hypothetical protein
MDLKFPTWPFNTISGCFDALGFYGNGTNGVIRSQDFKVLQNGTIVVARK